LPNRAIQRDEEKTASVEGCFDPCVFTKDYILATATYQTRRQFTHFQKKIQRKSPGFHKPRAAACIPKKKKAAKASRFQFLEVPPTFIALKQNEVTSKARVSGRRKSNDDIFALQLKPQLSADRGI